MIARALAPDELFGHLRRRWTWLLLLGRLLLLLARRVLPQLLVGRGVRAASGARCAARGQDNTSKREGHLWLRLCRGLRWEQAAFAHVASPTRATCRVPALTCDKPPRRGAPRGELQGGRWLPDSGSAGPRRRGRRRAQHQRRTRGVGARERDARAQGREGHARGCQRHHARPAAPCGLSQASL